MLAINIFDSIISSILFYNSEVWRGYLNSDFKKWDKSPVEKVQLRFCKIHLGVNSKACNVASRGKLGRLPLLTNIYKRMFKYIIHLNGLPESSIAKLAFLITKNIHLDGKTSFYSNVTEIKKLYVHSHRIPELESISN